MFFPRYVPCELKFSRLKGIARIRFLKNQRTDSIHFEKQNRIQGRNHKILISFLYLIQYFSYKSFYNLFTIGKFEWLWMTFQCIYDFYRHLINICCLNRAFNNLILFFLWQIFERKKLRSVFSGMILLELIIIVLIMVGVNSRENLGRLVTTAIFKISHPIWILLKKYFRYWFIKKIFFKHSFKLGTRGP